MPEEDEWIPVELEIVDRIWLPDTEILRLKGFHSLEVLGRLQVGQLQPQWGILTIFGAKFFNF